VSFGESLGQSPFSELAMAGAVLCVWPGWWDFCHYGFLWRRGLSAHRWPPHLSASYSAGSAVRAPVWQARCPCPGVNRQGYQSVAPCRTDV